MVEAIMPILIRRDYHRQVYLGILIRDDVNDYTLMLQPKVRAGEAPTFAPPLSRHKLDWSAVKLLNQISAK